MIYLGGKTRQGIKISRFLNALIARDPDNRPYYEPFVGAGGVLWRIEAPAGRFATDLNPDIIQLWKALQEGWIPPEKVTFRDWVRLQDAEPSPERTFAGFGCSAYGLWFHKYAHNRNDKVASAAKISGRQILTRAAKCEDVEFAVLDYRDLDPPPGAVIYCDPPYERAKVNFFPNTDSEDFNWVEFWAWAEALTRRGCFVYVSSYSAPPKWKSAVTVSTAPGWYSSGAQKGAEFLFRLAV